MRYPFALFTFAAPSVVFAQSPNNFSAANPQERLEAALNSDNAAEIKAAIKAGANPNGGNYSGHYLGIAATGGRLKAVKVLVESGADVNYASSGGWTAAMAAADNGHLEVLRYLALKKADLNARTRMGRTLLMRAAYHGQTAVVKYLLTKGIKVADVDMNGVTALMLAAQRGHDKTVKVLLDVGADKAAANSAQKTALMLAREAQAANGKKLEITGEGISAARRGTKIKIKTDRGEISATVTKTRHAKIKANAAKAGAEKGDAVYLDE